MAALPSDMQLDILTAELTQAIEKNDHNKALSIFRQMRGQGIDLPPRFTFVEARSLAELSKNLEARRALTEINRIGTAFAALGAQIDRP